MILYHSLLKPDDPNSSTKKIDVYFQMYKKTSFSQVGENFRNDNWKELFVLGNDHIAPAVLGRKTFSGSRSMATPYRGALAYNYIEEISDEALWN